MFFPRLVLLAIAVSAAVLAQSSQITGRITDPTGAVIATAPVSVVSVDSGAKFAIATNADGYYTVSRLDPGEYTVAVEYPGFRPVLRKGITLQVDQTVRLDLALEVGSASERIEISGAPPLVETETSDVGQVVENKTLMEMPLNGRNAWDLSMLSAGTVYVSGTGDAGEIPAVSIGGSRTMSQGFSLDGGSVQKSGLARGQAELAPMVDAVDEFKVITNNYAAEYGRSAGGMFTAATKSGTNQFRGNVFEFFRNDAVDARNFFALTRAPLRYNQFGGTLGGPIRKNKTHFFLALEATKNKRGQTVQATVPTLLQRNGDFSRTVNNQGRLLPIYNPLTTRPNPANPAVNLRDPFPGDVIPRSQWDPVGTRLMAFFPAPNLPGTLAGANNYVINVAPRRSQMHGTVRVDHQLSSKDRVFGRWVAQLNDIPEAPVFPDAPQASGLGPASRTINNTARSLVVSWVRTFSPTMLNDFKFATIDQDRAITHASIDQGWPEKLGIPNLSGRAFPIFRPAGYSLLGIPNAFRAQFNPGRQFTETVSWFRGAHNIKAGFEFRTSRTGDQFLQTGSGDFTFAQGGTGLQGNANTGNGLATMLMGFSTAFTLVDAPQLVFSSWYMGMFIQDDWKLTPRLTLNLGIRYDVEPGRVADNNTQNGFDLNRLNPVSGTPGVVTFAGGDEPRRVFNTDFNNVAPRFGLAWRPFGNGKTVLRGGFGLFFSNPDDQGYNTNAVLGFSRQANLVSGDLQGPAVLLSRGPGPIPQPTAADRTPGFGTGNAVNFYQRERPTPYSAQWNFGIQQQVKSVLLNVQYLGSAGVKLTAQNLSMNQIVPERLGLAGSTQSRRPFPQFTDVLLNSPNLGHSSYHGLVLRAEKRYRSGMQYLVNYTWSKFIDNVDALVDFGGTPGNGYMDYYNRGQDKSRSSNDIRNLVSFNAIYELPAGPGRRWLNTGVASKILGGWQLSGLGVMRSGAPYGITAQQNLCECFSSGPMRPNLLRDPNLPPAQRSPNRWFDTEAFTTPERLTWGNAARALGDGPGALTLNVALMKNFVLRERYRIQFRGESFNILNRTNFGMPGLGQGAPTFGIVSAAADARVSQFGLKIYF